MLLRTRAEVFGADIHDAVGVDVKGDLDLRHAAARRRDAVQLEQTERLVVLRKLTLALQHMNFHRGLIVHSRREDLALLGRDGGVAVDDLRHHATHGLHAQ